MGCEMYSHEPRASSHTPVNEIYTDGKDDKNPVYWPTWTLSALFRGVRHIHIDQHVYLSNISLSLRSRDTLARCGQEAPVV
jgi:hypothetical protein